MSRLASAILALLLALPVRAVEIVQTEVQHERGRYQIDFDVRIAAPETSVRTLMTDYARLARLSELVVESKVTELNRDGVRRLDMLLRGCILFVCRSVHKVEDIRTEGNGDIVTRAVPGAGDFNFSEERWHIDTDANRTSVRYTGVMEPAFFIPPIIGPIVMKYAIRKKLVETLHTIERLAASP